MGKPGCNICTAENFVAKTISGTNGKCETQAINTTCAKGKLTALLSCTSCAGTEMMTYLVDTTNKDHIKCIAKDAASDAGIADDNCGWAGPAGKKC